MKSAPAIMQTIEALAEEYMTFMGKNGNNNMHGIFRDSNSYIVITRDQLYIPMYSSFTTLFVYVYKYVYALLSNQYK